MPVKKTSTVSIRIRQNTYSMLQQYARDLGIKMPDLIDRVVDSWSNQSPSEEPPIVIAVDTPEYDSKPVALVQDDEVNPPTHLPERDVDGNPVAAWIRGL